MAGDTDKDEQGRSEAGHECRDLAFELGLTHRQLADMSNDLSGDPSNRTIEAAKTGSDRVEVVQTDQRPRRRVPGWVKLVEMPAEPVDATRALCHQVLAVIHQPPDLIDRHDRVGAPQWG